MSVKEILAKQDADYMAELLDKFKAFVLDSMKEGMHAEYDDHFEFLEDALTTFEDASDENDWSLT